MTSFLSKRRSIAMAVVIAVLLGGTTPALAFPITHKQAKVAIRRAWSGWPLQFRGCSTRRRRGVRCIATTAIEACSPICITTSMTLIEVVTWRHGRLTVQDLSASVSL